MAVCKVKPEVGPITLIGFKKVPQIDYWKLIYKNHRRPFLYLVLQIRVVPRGTDTHWINHWAIFCVLMDIDL